jgi:DNA modification methylase
MKQTETLPGVFDTTSPTLKSNHLYYGDNLTIMRTMPNACVDLIYLDPPFNSQRNYNLIYKKLTGLPVPEQEEAFCDAWDMDAEKEEMARRMPIVLREYGVDEDLVLFWKAWIDALRHTQPRLLAYLIYMSYRLFEMKRVLKPTGSLYLHCDPNASHYIKVIMDGVFGHNSFRNEVIWRRTGAHGRAKRWGPIHDVLLFYTKSDSYTWNRVYQQYDQSYLDNFYKFTDNSGRYRLVTLDGPGTRTGSSGQPWHGVDPTEKGRHWELPPDRALPESFIHPEGYSEMSVQERLDVLEKANLIYWPPKGKVPQYKRYLEVSEGNPVQDIIWDIRPIGSQAEERLGYPTQKPIALLKRLIEVSSNEGDILFDPFCGCGTAVYAAHLLNRKWIGCDIAILSVRLVRDVLLKRYGLKEDEHYTISGVPLSLEGAQDLFDRDPHQFQHWAVELAGGFSSTKHTGDEGIDGRIHFETKDGLKNMVISVKGGKLTPAFMRDLRGTMEREADTEMGGFICLEQPTKGMDKEVAKAGMYNYLGKDYPKLQIRTVQELLDGKGFDTPSKVQILGWQKQYAMPI